MQEKSITSLYESISSRYSHRKKNNTNEISQAKYGCNMQNSSLPQGITPTSDVLLQNVPVPFRPLEHPYTPDYVVFTHFDRLLKMIKVGGR